MISLVELRRMGYTAREIAEVAGLSVHQVRRRLRGGAPRPPLTTAAPEANWVRTLPRVDPGPIPAVDCPRLRRVLRLAVAQLALPVRVINSLEGAGVLTVWELLHCRREELLAIPNLSHRTLDAILSEVRRLQIPPSIHAA